MTFPIIVVLRLKQQIMLDSIHAYYQLVSEGKA